MTNLKASCNVNDQTDFKVSLAYGRILGKINTDTSQHYRYDALATKITANTNIQRRNSFDLGVGVDGKIAKNTWLGLGYNGRYAKKNQDQGLSLGLVFNLNVESVFTDSKY